MIKDSAIMTLNILKEKAHMNTRYCRLKNGHARYFHFSLYVKDGVWPTTQVFLRELGQRGEFKIPLEHFQEYYAECAPWEAIASMSCYD